MASRLWFVASLCLVLCDWTNGSLKGEKEMNIMNIILDKTRYDSRIRPGGVNNTDGPTIVQVNFFIRSISNLNDRKMKFDTQLTFRQQWVDERLKYNGDDVKYLTLTDRSAIWTPDTFFSNELEAHRHDVLMPNAYMRIFPSGAVLYSERLSLTMTCPMNLKLFPLDRQVCTLRIASYGWTTDDLIYLWKEGDPVQVVKNLHIEKFTLEKFFSDYCNSKTNTGEYSCLKADLLFARSTGHYVTQLFLPSTMLVVISWLTFWLDSVAITTRSMIGIVTLLAATAHSFMFNAALPAVSYSRASDVWMGSCLFFLFVALVESVVVNYMRRRERPSAGKLAPIASDEADGSTKSRLKERARELWNDLGKMSCSMKLDVCARAIFPVVFAIFVVLFYVTYSFRDEE